MNSIKKVKSQQDPKLLKVKSISPIEGHSKKRVDWLLKKICDEGVWKVPVKVEKTKFLLMDGHHRFEVAKLLNLTFIPVELFDYSEVEVFSLRKNRKVNVDIIFKNHEEGIIYPYKTAKHNFKSSNKSFEGISLNELK